MTSAPNPAPGPLTNWRARLFNWASPERLAEHEDKMLLVLTLVIGAMVGLTIAAFIVITENLGARLYPANGAGWRRLVTPLIGALVTGFLLKRYFPNARGSGIPQTKAALLIDGGLIPFRTVLGKFGLCSVSLASGIALGREGPSVQIGAGLASVLGQRLGLGTKAIQSLLPVGSAAALAAAFNTPVAAVLFTLEEVMGDMHAPVLGSIVLSSATSWIVMHLVLGDEPLFHVPAYQLVHPLEFGIYALLGVAGGLLSAAFVRFLLWQRLQFRKLPAWTAAFQPAAGGLVVGGLGWMVPAVLGVGYSFVNEALNGQMPVRTMALLVLLKLIATVTCYASGSAGGVFGPSLFLGAMLGGAAGSVAHGLLPDYTGSVGAYALVGMGTAFAGIIRVPMTSVIMIFEITRDYSIIVPLMISNLVSYFVAHRLQPVPLYEALQHQDGLHLPSSKNHRENPLTVSDAFAPLHPPRQWAASAVEFEAEHYPHVHPDQPLDTALRRMAQAGVKELPVLSRADVRLQLGTISLEGVQTAYGFGASAARLPQGDLQTTDRRHTGRLLLGIVFATALVLLSIGVASRLYRNDREQRARDSFETGKTLAAQGQANEAVEQFRNALSISPGRMDYREALGLALVANGKPAEATVYLRQALEAAPRGARAHLGLARAAALDKRSTEAVNQYRQAIFGKWPGHGEGERLEAEFEMASYLGRTGGRSEALLELHEIASRSGARLEDQRRAGFLMADLRAFPEASAVLRAVVRQDTQDAEAWAKLGRVEFDEGNNTAATDALERAVRLGGQEPGLADTLALARKIDALDPTLPNLTDSQRTSRGQELLRGAVAQARNCNSANNRVAQAESLLAARVSRARAGTSQIYVDAAVGLWRARGDCTNGRGDPALARLLDSLARHDPAGRR